MTKTSRIGLTGLTAVFVLTILTGCLGSSPAVRYYALSTEKMTFNNSDISLGIGPFELPEYLNRSQIVARGRNEQLIINEFDRWAENLEMSISRRLVSSISQKTPDLFVFEFIRTSSFPPDYRSFGQITRFEADQNNVVTLEAAWGVSSMANAQANTMNNSQRTSYEMSINSSNDMDEVTTAMGLLLDQFAQDIAAQANTVVSASEKAE